MEFSDRLKRELSKYEMGAAEFVYEEFFRYLKKEMKYDHPDNPSGNEEKAKEFSLVLDEARKSHKDTLKRYFEEKRMQRGKEKEYENYKNECELKIKGNGSGGVAGIRVKAAEGKAEPKNGIYHVMVTEDLLERKSYFFNEKSGKRYNGSCFFYEYGRLLGGMNIYLDEMVIHRVVIKGEGERAVKKVPRASFKECGLKELVVEKGVVEIEDGYCSCPDGTTITCHQESKRNSEARKFCGAFCRCASLECVTLPEGLVKIGDRAFKNCWNLKKVTFGEGLKTIGREAFMKTALEEIRLPKSVMKIERDAWKGCTKLKKIYVNSEEQKALIENCYLTPECPLVCAGQAGVLRNPSVSSL